MKSFIISWKFSDEYYTYSRVWNLSIVGQSKFGWNETTPNFYYLYKSTTCILCKMKLKTVTAQFESIFDAKTSDKPISTLKTVPSNNSG